MASEYTARPGDVLLVAYLRHPRWVSSIIQKVSRSWYSHAMIALGAGRYAHARPARGGNVLVLEGEDALASVMHDDAVYDLYRGDIEPDPARLAATVEHFQAQSAGPPLEQVSLCGRISLHPGMIFSDGNLLALLLLRWCQQWDRFRRTAIGKRTEHALVNAADDGEGRLLCSSFVHRVLDGAGARPTAPPLDKTLIDLADFPTDEPALLGGAAMVDWLLDQFTAELDFDWRTIQTCRDVVHVILCHWNRRTPVPDPLRVANFLTPGDLAKSPSLRKVATRYRLPNGEDSGWGRPLPLREFGTSFR